MISPVISSREQFLISQKNYLQSRLLQNQVILQTIHTNRAHEIDTLLAMENIGLQTKLIVVNSELESLKNRENNSKKVE